MFIQSFSSGPLKTNAILIACQKTLQAMVIDPSYGSFQSIFKVVQKNSFQVKHIFLTHSHWDHIADVFIMKEKFQSSVWVHPKDAENLIHPGSDGIPLLFEIKGVKPDRFLEDQMEIQVGEILFQVIHTPGHSPGSICFYFPKEKILVTGDTLFCGTMGALHLPTAEPEKMWSSLKRLGQLPPETRVLPGHGPETTIGKEHWLVQKSI